MSELDSKNIPKRHCPHLLNTIFPRSFPAGLSIAQDLPGTVYQHHLMGFYEHNSGLSLLHALNDVDRDLIEKKRRAYVHEIVENDFGGRLGSSSKNLASYEAASCSVLCRDPGISSDNVINHDTVNSKWLQSLKDHISIENAAVSTVPDVISSSDNGNLLSDERYQQIINEESYINTILTASKFSLEFSASNQHKSLANSNSTSKRKKGPSGGSSSRKTKKSTSTSGQGDLIETHNEEFDRWVNQLNYDMISLGEDILRRVRENRRRAWSCDQHFEICCKWCESSSVTSIDPEKLIQCLECGKIGCGNFDGSKRHTSRHFILSGHSIGMSCGQDARIFCMACGDFVEDEIIEREILFARIRHHFPWLSIKEKLLKRSVRSAEIEYTSNDYHWPGLLPTYPTAYSTLAEAGKISLNRLEAFHGRINFSNVPTLIDDLCFSQAQKSPCWWRMEPIGLFNVGNTCYINCVLQVLLHTPLLQKFFLQNVKHDYRTCQYLRNCYTKSKENGEKLERECVACAVDKLFVDAYSSYSGKNILKILENESANSDDNKTMEASRKVNNSSINTGEESRENNVGYPITPANILKTCWTVKDMKHLAGYEQHDAHEFLQAFLDTLSKHIIRLKEICFKSGNPSTAVATEDNSPCDDVIGDELVQSNFEGKMSSLLLCEACGAKRSQSEKFLNVSLPIPKSNSKAPVVSKKSGERQVPSRTRGGVKNTVYTCLENFTAAEDLGDAVHCPVCDRKSKTKKRFIFSKLPNILSLHFKRFNPFTNEKMIDPVSFPKELDMGSFVPHWCESMEKSDTQAVEDERMETTADNKLSVKYKLYAVINHVGSVSQGHYTADVKIDGQWYFCNDACVYFSDETAVLAKEDEAYMLFYERCG